MPEVNKIPHTICFGEILFRFAPSIVSENLHAQELPVFIGGAELNVARALAKWECHSAYCTAMPDNFLTEGIIECLQKENLDLDAVKKQGKRMGIYYLTSGQDLKNAGVVFDREGSSFSALQVGDIDWGNILTGKNWFHISAISASLTQSAADVCLEALKAAKAQGVKTSIDLNYREKLWKYGRQPTEIIPALLPYCDVVMGNMWASESLAGIVSPLESSKGKEQPELQKAAEDSINTLRENYPNVRQVIYTFRLQDNYWALLADNTGVFVSKDYAMGDATNRVGSGDCFMAGIIYGNSTDMDAQETVDFAAAAAVGKLYEAGDHTKQSVDSIKEKYK